MEMSFSETDIAEKMRIGYNIERYYICRMASAGGILCGAGAYLEWIINRRFMI